VRPLDPVADGGPPPKRKLKKLRLALVLILLSALALLSTVFGMMMAVSNELPSLEAKAQFRAARNSSVFSDGGKVEIAHLTDNQNRILLNRGEISPIIKNAAVAIEDKRFYEHQGVDFTGIARAVGQDLLRQGAAQGASTITQQFVKNALAAQRNRTVFQKLREAALAYHLERRWSKDKILSEYLNTIYFGNGAYGIESAVRTYFGGRGRHYLPQDRLATAVSPDQAALLAGLIASPSAYDPAQHPIAAEKRRDLVLKNMLDQKMITPGQYDQAVRQAIPAPKDINPPQPDSTQPYYSTWVAQQLVDRYGAGAAFGGGFKVQGTLDPAFQQAAQQAIQGRLAGVGPSASAVVIDNQTGEVRAMVGGNDFMRRPFNLATNGHRQPGSAIKPFILATALQSGISPLSVWTSGPKTFTFTVHGKRDVFVVHNFQNAYSGSATLAHATQQSDNSIFAEVGLKVGTKRIARNAQRMGIRTKVSTNPAMVLGGLKQGVTPLEMAFAYSTIANYGVRHSGTLASQRLGPVAIERVSDASGRTIDKDKVRTMRVYSHAIGAQMRDLLHAVVTSGTGTSAQVSDWSAGKTGTTENYGDAWFVGFTDRFTAAVWVGYPDGVKSMKTDYHGAPVEGGTYPAEIWHDMMQSIIDIDAARHPLRPPTTPQPSTIAPSQSAPTTPAPSQQTPQQQNGPGAQQPATPRRNQAPQRQPTPPANQQPAQPQRTPGTGGGAGGGTPPAAGQ
jgi:penicillin-binding protein 1A